MAEARKISRRPWSQDEVRLLRRHFADMDTRRLAAKIGRPLTAVRQRAYEMGLKTNGYSGPWSAEEVALLKELYPKMSTRRVAERIGRTMQSVGQKSLKLGLKKTDEYLASIGFVSEPKKWTQDDIALVGKMYASKSVNEIAAELGRSVPTVRQRAHKMGLRKKEYLTWSLEEVRKLKSQFPDKTIKQIAVELGRSVNSVRQKAHRMELKKRKGRIETATPASVM